MKVSGSWRRRGWVLVGLILVYAVVGFWVLPPIVKSQLERRATEQTGRKTTVETVHVNPFAFSVTLDHFAIYEKDGTTPFVGWRHLYVRAAPFASIWSAWELHEVDLDGFHAQVAVKADKTFNFSDILAKLAQESAKEPKTAASPKPGRPFKVGRVEVADARVNFSDKSNPAPFATTLGPVTFAVTGFATVPDKNAPYLFQAATESGEGLAWSGSLQAVPPRSAGVFRISNLELKKYSPYYANLMAAEVDSGRLTVAGSYTLDLTPGAPVMKLQNGSVQLRDFRLVERASRLPAVELPSVDIDGIEADALTHQASVQSVTVAGGAVHVRRAKDGTINLLALLPRSGPSNGVAGPKPEVTVANVVIHQFGVDASDASGPMPAQLALSSLELSLKNLSLAPHASMPLSLAFDWAPQGAVKVDGRIGIQPIAADLKMSINGLSFLPLSAYLEQFANARIAQGSLTAALAVQANLTENRVPAARIAGDVEFDHLSLVDGEHSKDLAGYQSIKIKGLKAGTSPQPHASISEIDIDGPYVRARVNPDRSINLLAVLPKAATAAGKSTAAKVTPSAASAIPQIAIGKVVIAGGNFHFVDQSLEPNAALDVDQFGGTIAGLSSENFAKAEVDLKTDVGGIGRVAITGKLDPFGRNRLVDLNIDARNIDLVPLSPYSGKYAGYELARGKLKLDIHAKVTGDTLDSTDVITLNGFTFGGNVPSKDATTLPVRLGVALLKDREGNIVIDVPIQGTVGDPNFKIGRVVQRVIGNLLVKAATSPFSLLGSMFGGGGDELAYQEFAPGSAALESGQVKKLETMTKALTNRPALSLAIEGDYDSAADAYALKRLKLEKQVRRAIWADEHASNPTIAPPDQLTITPEQSAAKIKQLFDAKFPPGTEFGTPLPPPPAVAEPPPPAKNFFQRVVAIITFQGLRDRHKAHQENDRRQAAYRVAVSSAKAAGMPLDEMSGHLAEAVEISPDDLLELAGLRAQTVRDYLMNTGHISPDRLFLAKLSTASKADKGPRVFLSLQ